MMTTELQRYADWAPTGFDTPGLNANCMGTEDDEDRREWLVGPSQTRDSDALELSNFQATLEILGGESDTVEVHRFGHWACGWVEIILVAPAKAAELADIAARLEDYPVLDEEDWSNREHDDAVESWDSWACSDFIDELVRSHGLSDLAKDRLQDADTSTLWEFHMDHSPYGYSTDEGGANFNFDYLAKMDRETIAELLRGLRAAV